RDDRCDDRRLPPLQEVKIRLREKPTEVERLKPLLIVSELKDDTRAVESTEHTGEDAEHECHRETAHLVGTNEVQDGRGDEAGDVTIQDWMPRTLVAKSYRRWNSRPAIEFFPNALEHENIGVHRHADREHEPS